MLTWLLIAAWTLALIWTAAYAIMRRAFPPQDEVERMHLNRIGRRTAICMLVIVLVSVVYWMTR